VRAKVKLAEQVSEGSWRYHFSFPLRQLPRSHFGIGAASNVLRSGSLMRADASPTVPNSQLSTSSSSIGTTLRLSCRFGGRFESVRCMRPSNPHFRLDARATLEPSIRQVLLGQSLLQKRRRRQERLKREGKSVNLSSATVPRLRKARPGGACSRMRGKCVNRAHRPSAARQKCPHHVPGFRGSDGAAFKSRSVSRDSPAKVRRQGPWCQRSAVAQPVHTAAPGTPEGCVEQPIVESVFADEPRSTTSAWSSGSGLKPIRLSSRFASIPPASTPTISAV